MNNAKIKQLQLNPAGRTICISDIHGEITLFKTLLAKVGFCDADMLILLGDLYLKGTKPHETLKYCMELGKKPNVHILKGNCDWGGDDYLNQQEVQWLADLPDIIDGGDFIFVHSGLFPGSLEEQPSATSAKYDNFMEAAPAFDKWIVTGHWPVAMYCHDFPRHSPIVDADKRIITIDGGNVIKPDGQLNAFIIQNGSFSYEFVDNLPEITAEKDQEGPEGSLSLTWLDRFVEITEDTEPLCRVRHLQTGRILTVPKSRVWTDPQGRTCICDLATDHHLTLKAGDTIKLVEAFPDRIFAKARGVSGWIML